MKYVLLLLSALAFSGCSAAPKRLNDSYAIAALTALKAIEGDTFVQNPGSNLVSRFTQEKIDATDVLAVSNEEKHIADTLNQVYAAKVNLNWQVKARDLSLKIAQDSRLSPVFTATDRQKDDAEANQRSLAVATSSTQLDKCFSDLDASLRARALEVPVSCGQPFK